MLTLVAWLVPSSNLSRIDFLSCAGSGLSGNQQVSSSRLPRHSAKTTLIFILFRLMPKFFALGFYPFLAQASEGVFGGPAAACSSAADTWKFRGISTESVRRFIARPVWKTATKNAFYMTLRMMGSSHIWPDCPKHSELAAIFFRTCLSGIRNASAVPLRAASASQRAELVGRINQLVILREI